MQQNLAKFTQLQKEKEKLQLQEQKKVELAPPPVVEPVKSDEPRELEVVTHVGFTIRYQNFEKELMESQRKDYIEAINQLSKYNDHLFVQYLGIQILQEKIDAKREEEKKEGKKEEKKSEKNQEHAKKEQIKAMNENKESEKKQESNASVAVQSKFKLKLLTEERLSKFDLAKFKKQNKSRGEFLERFHLSSQILSAVSSLHDLQYTFYPLNLEDIIMIKHNQVKLSIHNAKLWRLVLEEQLNEVKAKEANKFKKQTMLNPSLKYTSPQFIIKSISLKDVRQNDIWKTGVLILTLLLGEDLTKDLLALESIDETKVKEFKLIDQARTTKLKKYLRSEDISEILKMVSVFPAERPKLKSLKQLFQKARVDLNQFLDPETLETAKSHYLKEQSAKTFKFLPEFKASEEILTIDHRKKLTEYFKINQNRTPKDYKLQYRASQTQFSCRSFYQIAYDKKNLLIVILQKLNNKKLICYSEEVFDLSKCNGVFGGFVKDTKKLSFIYSPQENEFCKLKNADRAIGVSHTQGPIIGDGDLVISDGALSNICRFPSSYESIKLKKLLKADRFEVNEYDVYQVIF